jgi:sugar fermentation stimulation protein A
MDGSYTGRMRWPNPLIPGRLIRRYKRFLADVELPTGGEVTVHCPNPGRMLGLDAPGSRVWLSEGKNPLRKLPLTLELVEADGGLVGINTTHPNRLVEEAICAGRIEELAGYREMRREIRYDGGSRIDLLLREPGRPDCYVEVKNVHLRRAAAAEFPDCVTARGARHLAAMRRQVGAGARAVLVYVVQRTDCAEFAVAEDIDPVYAGAFRAALAGGVEALCRACRVSLDGIELSEPLPIDPGVGLER